MSSDRTTTIHDEKGLTEEIVAQQICAKLI